jgi:hypothetical protein
MRKLRLSLAAVLVMVATPVFAQRTTGTIRGTVNDSTGAIVPGATVTLKSEGTGLTRTATTSSGGAYSFAELPVGSYRVEVSLSGFKSAVVNNVALNVADDRQVNVTLETGAVAEVVTVEADTVAIQTIGGDLAGLVTGEQARDLPLNGRNFMQLTLLMPGVSAPDTGLKLTDKGLLGGSDLSVSGSAVTANLWTVDGANNNDIGSNRTILIYPSIDAIEEFKIHRNAYGAEFGQAAGAHVNVVTRGGTNEFHGSAFYFGRNDALNSKNYFLEQAGKDKENLSRHDFGYTFGGPILKDKLHFFVSQEWNREKRGTVRAFQVPTAAERAGDFSQPTRCSFATPNDPVTGSPFPGNRIPSNRLSPGGLLYAQLFPLPNTTPAAGSCNNWVTSLDTPINWRQENIRLDYTVTPSTRLMMRYTQDSWENGDPNLWSAYWGDDPFPAVDSTWTQPGRSLVAQLNQNIGSRAINTLTFSYSGNKITTTRGGESPDLNNRINAAIPPLYPENTKRFGADRSHPVFWGGLGYGQNLWNQAPFVNNQDLFILKDDYSAVFGKHSFKAGALASFNKKNEEGGGAFDSPAFWGPTGLNGWGGTTGNTLADLLLKDMAFGFTEFSSNRQAQQRWKDLEAYVQDSWKVHPRVTVDYGIRWSNYFAVYLADDKITNFDPATFNPALGNDPCNGLIFAPGTNPCRDAGQRGGTEAGNRALVEDPTNLFGPRFGIAWDVSGNGKTSVRAGLGRSYLRERTGPNLGVSFVNPPFTQIRTGTRLLDTATPCDGCLDPIGAGRPTRGIVSDGKAPNNWQWNVTVERELRRNTTLELSYVGNKGSDLLRTFDLNQVRVGDVNRNGVQDRLDYVRAGDDNAAQAALRPFGVFGDGTIGFFDHSGSSIYHSLQTQIVSRFGRGSQFQASYTWSRLIADDPLNDSGASPVNGSVTDRDNPALDRGLAAVHRAHIANASLVLNLPTLENKTGFAKNVLGDWQIASLVYAATGEAITVYTGTIPGIGGGVSGTGYNDNQRPNRVDGQPCRATGGPKEQYLNPAAFTLDGFALGSVGTAGRGVCTGPATVSVDLALFKNIKLSSRVRAQLRFEVFNALNRVNFITNSFAGQGIDNVLDPSAVTLDGPLATASRVTSATIPTSFGQARATREPRQAQFGLKIIF